MFFSASQRETKRESLNTKLLTPENQLRGGRAREKCHTIRRWGRWDREWDRCVVCSVTVWSHLNRVEIWTFCFTLPNYEPNMAWKQKSHDSVAACLLDGVSVSSCQVRVFGCRNTSESRNGWTEASFWTTFYSAQLFKCETPLLAARHKHFSTHNPLCLQVIMFSHLTNCTAALLEAVLDFRLFWTSKCFCVRLSDSYSFMQPFLPFLQHILLQFHSNIQKSSSSPGHWQ